MQDEGFNMGRGNTLKYLFSRRCIIKPGNKYFWAVVREKQDWEVGICSEIDTIYLLSPAMLNCLKLVERGLEELFRLWIYTDSKSQTGEVFFSINEKATKEVVYGLAIKVREKIEVRQRCVNQRYKDSSRD